MTQWEEHVLTLMDKGRYSEALVALRALRRQDIDDFGLRTILLNEARCLREMGEFKQALGRYRELKENHNISGSDRCLCLLCEAKTLQEMKRFRDARGRLGELRRLDSVGEFAVETELVEINILFDEDKLEQAIKSSESFLTRRREELSGSEYSGRAYKLELKIACELVNAGHYKRGLEAIQQLLSRAAKADLALLYLYMGVAYEDTGESGRAIASYKGVLSNTENADLLARAHYHLGAHYYKNGATAWAKQHLLEAERIGLPLDISPRELYKFLAAACAHVGEFEEYQKYARLAK